MDRAKGLNKKHLIELLDRYGIEWEYSDDPVEIEKSLDLAIEALKQMEIVRCKDCKFFSIEGEPTHFGYCNVVHEHDTDPNGYCHHGERKE